MEPKKIDRICFIINAVLLVFLQYSRWGTIVNFLEFRNNICSPNNTLSTTSNCQYTIVAIGLTFCLCVSQSVFHICWQILLSLFKKKVHKMEEQSTKLGEQLVELKRQLDLQVNGRAVDNEPYNREPPNEREHLLAQNQLPNYQAT